MALSVESLPQKKVHHRLLQHESFLKAAVLHGSLPCGLVLQEKPVSEWVTHMVTNPASKLAPMWSPLSMASQVLLGTCSSENLPWGHIFSRHILALMHGVLHGYLLYRGLHEPASLWSSPQAVEESLLQLLECLLLVCHC